MGEIILKTRDLTVDFKVRNRLFGRPDRLSAVQNVNIEVRRGEVYGLVGESGCGKTTLANTLLGFVPITSGAFECFGHTIDHRTKPDQWKAVRRHMQTVFQDPYTSLNSRFTVWQIISEPLFIAGERNERVLRERAASLVEKVGLSREDLDRYIFEFSGGQRQRVAIARALVAGAELIICDEPTSALDVSVHSQICNLLLDLRDEFELTYLFISHNLSLVKHITDHMAVMYLGEVMESGATAEIFAHPVTPYTRALMSAIPEVNPSGKRERIILTGEARSPINPPDLCRFASRCPEACDICRCAPLPPAICVGADHTARCHLTGKEWTL
ncbi:MAG: ATP-binding cassette domain-containing protein [Oscillospiraceae bacterium]|nr:ATP-binding cassette domain-containing protein [Oscillospiraceae bacterium]